MEKFLFTNSFGKDSIFMYLYLKERFGAGSISSYYLKLDYEVIKSRYLYEHLKILCNITKTTEITPKTDQICFYDEDVKSIEGKYGSLKEHYLAGGELGDLNSFSYNLHFLIKYDLKGLFCPFDISIVERLNMLMKYNAVFIVVGINKKLGSDIVNTTEDLVGTVLTAKDLLVLYESGLDCYAELQTCLIKCDTITDPSFTPEYIESIKRTVSEAKTKEDYFIYF